MVRELFVMAREHAPTIIFMDEAASCERSCECVVIGDLMSEGKKMPSEMHLLACVLLCYCFPHGEQDCLDLARSILLAPPVWKGNLVVIQKCNVRCWNCSTSWMALRHRSRAFCISPVCGISSVCLSQATTNIKVIMAAWLERGLRKSPIKGARQRSLPSQNWPAMEKHI